MKPHEKLGVAIANAGYDWTPEMRSAWEELDRQTKPLSDEEIPILTILQSAHSVRLGDAIYESDAEYEKLKKIVVAAVKWTQERHGIK